MTVNRIRRTALPLGLVGAIAAIAIAGGSFSGAVVAKPSPDKSLAAAQVALGKGQIDKAIALAETAVAGNPREPSYRALLGQAYLRAGRFESAVTTLDDAMKLGDNTGKTALALSLANVAAGNSRAAVAILDDWRDAIPASDLGLALALSGESSRGVAVLADALRGGENSVKVRQNLAYAYALDGRWREARTMVAQDVPANLVDGRISDWAMKARPEDHKLRIAALLSAPLRADPGQPATLALANSAAAEQLAAERSAAPLVAAAAPAPVPAYAAAPAELPAVADVSPAAVAELASYAPVEAVPAAPAEAPVYAAPAPAAVQQAGMTFVSNPVVQALPTRYQAKAAPRTMAAAKAAPKAAPAYRMAAATGGAHAVQLGSFKSPQGARRAWGYYAAKNPELKNFRMVITPAKVKGRDYWRVAAAGLNASGAQGMCSSVKARGGVCFAYTTQPNAVGKAPAPMLARAKPAPKKAAPAPAKNPNGLAMARRH
ncbi:lipopolysaccharide assembly protein LapB [Novosphingobium sp.]|uniref:tetratricopeptide repeat protein n=1 Tax=Novosphingobium sp. TaxID=1874826 RepID=UPI002735EE95|nr:tetratricopeptide repeat protein [Novosphingobium sp.]MDP3908375.1 tetratricopeptide repeat protein [Novosphingobium sp.]